MIKLDLEIYSILSQNYNNNGYSVRSYIVRNLTLFTFSGQSNAASASFVFYCDSGDGSGNIGLTGLVGVAIIQSWRALNCLIHSIDDYLVYRCPSVL